MFISRLSELLSEIRFRLRALLQGNTVEAELDLELRSHLDHEIAKLVGAGATQEQAVRRARMAFGGMDQVKEECRESRGVGLGRGRSPVLISTLARVRMLPNVYAHTGDRALREANLRERQAPACGIDSGLLKSQPHMNVQTSVGKRP